MSTAAPHPPARTASSAVVLARALGWLARWLDVYSAAAVRVARFAVVAGTVLVAVALAGNVFTRNALGFSVFFSDDLARFSFLWVIWMGVSLAVKRSAVTVITFVSDRGPPAWQRSVKTFSGVSLAILLGYACVRATQFATGNEVGGVSSGSGWSFFYPIASMAVGYYFITLHYAQQVTAAGARTAARGLPAVRDIAGGLIGGASIGAVVWGICWGLLQIGVTPLIPLGVIFVALTLSGTPIVFMLSIVGIVAMFSPGFLGLAFYPNPNPITPFSTTQFTMGLSGGLELLTILMFLIVAEVMNASGMSRRLMSFAATVVGHFRGGMAYVAQVTSVAVSGISGSAQADAAIMTPVLVPAMEREGYRRDVAAAVVAGASIKGPIGPLSIMFIAYGAVVSGVASASISALLLSGILAELLLFVFQAATVYVVVRKMDFLVKRPFAGMDVVVREGVSALPVFIIPAVILGGIFSGLFTPPEAAAIGVFVTAGLAFFWYAGMSPRQLIPTLVLAGIETGIVLLLVGDSAILGKALTLASFGQELNDFLTGITTNKYVFLLIVNLLLLAVGIFVEPLPALVILAPFLAPVAVVEFGIDPVHFGLIMVFNLVLALIHPPIGLVIFLVSSIAKVSVERLSIMILPWLAVSLLVLFLVTYLPSEAVLGLANLIER